MRSNVLFELFLPYSLSDQHTQQSRMFLSLLEAFLVFRAGFYKDYVLTGLKWQRILKIRSKSFNFGPMNF